MRYLGGGVSHLILRGIVRVADAMKVLIDATLLSDQNIADEDEMGEFLTDNEDEDEESDDEDGEDGEDGGESRGDEEDDEAEGEY